VGYDEGGNPMTGSFMSYEFPSAAELPSFETAHTETPTPMNPLGAKGIGESGTIGSTPAVQNAAVDAVSFLGVKHIDMPLTPERGRGRRLAVHRGQVQVPAVDLGPVGVIRDGGRQFLF